MTASEIAGAGFGRAPRQLREEEFGVKLTPDTILGVQARSAEATRGGGGERGNRTVSFGGYASTDHRSPFLLSHPAPVKTDAPVEEEG